MAPFSGKVALVTGATSGIGRATALAFARAGARVVAAGRRTAEGAATVALIEAAGGEAVFVPTDVREEAAVARLVSAALDRFGGLDCAFNNAGSIALAPLAEASDADYRPLLDTNVEGVFLCLKHEIGAMRRRGGGAIVNSASLAGLKGSRDLGLYAASKHAVMGLTRTAALEAAEHGIRVNAVCPGAIAGAMDELFMRHFAITHEQLAAAVPLRRAGTPEDVAAAVLFLCSDAAAFVTGAALSVDGGLGAL